MTRKKKSTCSGAPYTQQDLNAGLKVVDQLARKDGDGLIQAVAEYMLLHGMNANPDNVAQIPTSTSH